MFCIPGCRIPLFDLALSFPPCCLPTPLPPFFPPPTALLVPSTPAPSLPCASYRLFTPMPSPALPLSYSNILYSFETLSIRPLHSGWFLPLSHTISKCLHGFHFIYLFISPPNASWFGGKQKNNNKKTKLLSVKELSCFLDPDGEKTVFLLYSLFFFVVEPTTVTVRIQENLDWLLKTRVFSTVLIKKKAKKKKRNQCSWRDGGIGNRNQAAASRYAANVRRTR